MVDLYLKYTGDLRCEALHGPSQSHIVTDAPVDNHGRGQAFSPTDLVGTALGACMLTVMGIAAQAHRIELTGTTAHVVKEMTQQRPRRIARLTVKLSFPSEVSQLTPESIRHELEAAAENCPVRLSLSDAVHVSVGFDWQ